MQTPAKRPRITVETPCQFGPYALGPPIIESDDTTAVYRGHRVDCPAQQVAIKLVRKERLSLARRRDLDREITILRELQSHPGIVRLLYVHDDGDCVAIVMPLADADLFCYLDGNTHLLDEDMARTIFTAIVEAVAYCHERGICHRDLKVENVLLYFDDSADTDGDAYNDGDGEADAGADKEPNTDLDSVIAMLTAMEDGNAIQRSPQSPHTGTSKRKRTSQALPLPDRPPSPSPSRPFPLRPPRVVLTDFGFAESYSRGTRLAKWCGTLLTAAPEILQQRPYAPEAADVWSLGSILYTLLASSFPFYADERAQIVERTIKGAMRPLPKHISEGARQLVSLMLNRDPAQRPTLRQVLAHSFLCRGTARDNADLRDGNTAHTAT
jgi:serine/threonine protein kinase